MMTGMSFSIAAKGTRDECLNSLNGEIHHRLTGEGQIVRGMLLGFMADEIGRASCRERVFLSV